MTFKMTRYHLNQMNPIDLVEQLETMNLKEMVTLIMLLDKDLLADTFAHLSSQRQLSLIRSLQKEKTSEIINELEANELVNTIRELPANMVNKLLIHLDPKKEKIVHTLLGYELDSVGSIMSVRYKRYTENTKIQQALNHIEVSECHASHLEIIWVTDDKLKLKGFVYLADLLRSNATYFYELLQPISFSIHANDDQENLVPIALKYNFSNIPVVDSEYRMVGIVPTEWIVGILSNEFEEDLDHLSGINDSSKDGYHEASVWHLSKSRVTWLIICLLTATLTGFIIQRYEETLAASVLLAAYIPMLMDSGGNAGTQSATTIIQAMAKNKLSGLKVMIKESLIGLIVGFILVGVNIIRMLIIDHAPLEILITVSITLLITIMLSKIIGGLLPIIANKFEIDPTVMSGPIITTIVDTFVLIVYFEIAQFFISF